MTETWRTERRDATADEIHALGLPSDVDRLVRIFTPTRSALVLGSTQPESDADAEVAQKLGVDIVKRRSGGGAVLVEPNDLVWLDLLIPADDPLWVDDVGRAFHWLGHIFARALHDIGIGEVKVHEGALQTTPWSRRVCFAGLGPGECTLNGKKVLGVSQRRTRQGALFQVSVIKRFDGAKLAQLLSVPSEVMIEEIVPRVGELPDLDEAIFLAALLRRLNQV